MSLLIIIIVALLVEIFMVRTGIRWELEIDGYLAGYSVLLWIFVWPIGLPVAFSELYKRRGYQMNGPKVRTLVGESKHAKRVRLAKEKAELERELGYEPSSSD